MRGVQVMLVRSVRIDTICTCTHALGRTSAAASSWLDCQSRKPSSICCRDAGQQTVKGLLGALASSTVLVLVLVVLVLALALALVSAPTP
jgi:hypothetical protein